MKLRIQQLPREEVYKDMARIPEGFRMDKKGSPIPEGRICKVKAAGRSKLLSLRGREGESGAVILMDAKSREDLSVAEGAEEDFTLTRVWLVGQFLWSWRASDPLYRIPAQVALLSAVFGALGALLGALSLFLACKGR